MHVTNFVAKLTKKKKKKAFKGVNFTNYKKSQWLYYKIEIPGVSLQMIQTLKGDYAI